MKRLIAIMAGFAVALVIYAVLRPGSKVSTHLAPVLPQALAPKPHPFDYDIVKLMPADTMGLGVCDYRLPAAQRFQTSPLIELLGRWIRDPEKTQKLFEQLKMNIPREENGPDPAAVLDIAKKLFDAFSEENKRNADLKTEETMFFTAQPKEALPLRLTFLGRVSSTYDPAPLIGRLKDLGMIIREEQHEGVTLHVWDIVDQLKKIGGIEHLSETDREFLPKLGLFFGSEGKSVAFSTEPLEAVRVLKGRAPEGPPSDILRSDYLQKLRNAIRFSHDESICVTVTDYRRAMRSAIELAKATKPETETDPMVAKVNRLIDGFPLVAEINVSGYRDGFLSHSGFVFAEKSELIDLSSWIGPLRKSGPVTVTESMPDNVLMAISMNARSFADFRGLIASAATGAAPQELIDQAFAFVSDLTEVGLYAAYVAGEEVFPEVTFVFAANRPAAALEFIKSAPEKFLPEQMKAVGPWIEKTVQGQKSWYIATPLGVGAFISATDRFVIVSSSEVGLDRALGAATAKKKKLSQRLSEHHLLDGSDALLFFYLDFEEMMRELDGLLQSQPQLAAGAPPIPQELRELVTVIGQIAMTVNIKEDIFETEFRQREVRSGTMAGRSEPCTAAGSKAAAAGAAETGTCGQS